MWLLLALLMLGRFYQPMETPIVSAQGDPSQEIVRLVNDLRIRNGLPPLIWDGRLAAAAQNQAGFMAANNVYSHTGAGGSSPQSRAAAAGFPGRATENVVGGTNLSPGQGVIWWQNSPVHLNTLLSPQYTHVGTGSASGFDQNFYALVAGAPSNVIAPSLPEAEQPGDQLLAAVAPIILAEPRDDGSIIHSVGPGQSFWVIAARYEVPLEQLYLFNNLSEGSVISPGDEIVIRLPEGQEPPPTPTPPPFHIVRDGDSWWTIAAWHKLSVADILWLNSASEDSVLRAGDKVRIALLAGESPPPTATPQLTHIVAAGETAWDIAIRYGLALGDLLQLNELGDDAMLSIGEELMIVTVTSTATASPLPTHTPDPTQTPTQTATSLPTPQALSKASDVSELPATQMPENSQSFSSTQLGQTGLAFGVASLIIGVLAIIFVWRWID